VKPFNPAEVVARSQAVLRRVLASGTQDHSRVLRVVGLEIDLDQHEVIVRSDATVKKLLLTLTEFKLLLTLARTPKKVFSRMELLTSCLPEGDTLERTVDSHISKLRKKLEDAGISGVPAVVRGVGYKLLVSA
jgi:two-component system response regulator AdeR